MTHLPFWHINTVFTMPPDLMHLIQVISLEAIKVLGPAAIAAFATYRVTAIQFESKIKELDKTNEFHARDRIFAYLTERIAKVDADFAKLNEEIGRVLGFTLGGNGGEQSAKQMQEFIEVLGGGMMTLARGVSLEVNSLLQDMRDARLATSEEIAALQEHQKFSYQQVRYGSFEELKISLFLLLNIYNTMGICMRRLLNQEMSGVFDDYVKK